MMLMPVLLIVMMLFMTRGQNKKQKELETFQSNLKKGDSVVTTAGLLGRVVEIGEREARVEIAPGVTVRVLKSAIASLEGADATKEVAKEKPQEKKA